MELINKGFGKVKALKGGYDAWKAGATFDAWNERFNYPNWLDAFKKNKLEPEFYAQRERSLEEALPWAHIDSGVTTEFLKREFQRALKETETPDCHYHPCNTCGLERLSAACKKKLGD